MNNINLEKLYKYQQELDEEIANIHHVDYKSTHQKRLLALLVEIGELANETRCFKYWSNKGPSPKERIMDEYADGLHFFLSLGIPLKTTKFEYELNKNEEDLTDQFHKLYSLIVVLQNNYNLENYIKAISYFLNLAYSLDMTSNDIVDSYMKKLNVNHKRQETNY